MLLKFFGMSEPSAATKRRRSCRARSEGELLRLESVGGERTSDAKKRCRRAVHALCDGDNVECFHPCQAFLQLLDEDSEGSL
jgi:hypothetical protein